MRDGARMTVRSRPTSKHVPRKERRYHVKKNRSVRRREQSPRRKERPAGKFCLEKLPLLVRITEHVNTVWLEQIVS